MIKFPSIAQFRNVIKAVKHKAQFAGVGADGNVIYNKQQLAPKLNFFGTVKLHGTNASIVQESGGSALQYQSRENVLDTHNDNAGFCNAMIPIEESALIPAFDYLRKYLNVHHFTEVTIYGEWCGGNIQKGVAINGLDKMFVVFAIRLGKEKSTEWIRPHMQSFSKSLPGFDIRVGFYSISEFKTYQVLVDFEQPEVAQNTFVKLTIEVEEQCPVAKFFGNDGIGEGIVWHCTEPGYESSDFVFKTKGEKHSASKVKVIAAVDVERITAIKELVDTIMTDNRLSQMVEGIELDSKNTGEFIKKCMQDAIKEEKDTIEENGFTVKEFSNFAMSKCRTWFFQKLS